MPIKQLLVENQKPKVLQLFNKKLYFSNVNAFATILKVNFQGKVVVKS
jgi:hypothetical protein